MLEFRSIFSTCLYISFCTDVTMQCHSEHSFVLEYQTFFASVIYGASSVSLSATYSADSTANCKIRAPSAGQTTLLSLFRVGFVFLWSNMSFLQRRIWRKLKFLDWVLKANMPPVSNADDLGAFYTEIEIRWVFVFAQAWLQSYSGIDLNMPRQPTILQTVIRVLLTFMSEHSWLNNLHVYIISKSLIFAQ